MSGFALMLEGTRLDALVVGGGAIATRKVRALLESGARVRVIAPDVSAALVALEAEGVRVERRPYAAGDIGDEQLVIAATNARDVNHRVAADAHVLNKLVVVADAPAEGTCWMPATHRAGELLIAVSAAGVPTAAMRIRDAIAERFDGRYAEALATLQLLRRKARDDGAGMRPAATVLVGDDFCAAVESGAFAGSRQSWD